MKDNYDLFPKKNILPFNGMSINADVWREAHNYHMEIQNAHQYFVHGSGIVYGLEVVASDPPDSVIYVLPGVAIDTAGQMIVLPEPVAYDLGAKIDGNLRLLLLHREVKSKPDGSGDSHAQVYMQAEYIIVARPDLVEAPHVELARIFRKSVKDAINDADDPDAPQPNAIDLRHRIRICPPPAELASVGVCTLGSVPEMDYSRGLINLAKPLSEDSPYNLVVENNVLLDKEVFKLSALYLVATRNAKLTKKQADTLQTYLENGGRVLLEFCERIDDDIPADLLKPAAIKISKVPFSHPLYQTPHLFLAPPPGSTPQEDLALWYGAPGVLCTNAGYGGIWSGQIQQQPAVTRSVVRDAIEWGVNLFNFLISN